MGGECKREGGGGRGEGTAKVATVPIVWHKAMPDHNKPLA